MQVHVPHLEHLLRAYMTGLMKQQVQTSNILSTHDPSNRLNLFLWFGYLLHTHYYVVYTSVCIEKAFQVAQVVKNLLANARDMRGGFDPWVGKTPWRRAWQLTPIFLPTEPHVQRSPAGYSPQGLEESDTTEVTYQAPRHVLKKSLLQSSRQLFVQAVHSSVRLFPPIKHLEYFYKAN